LATLLTLDLGNSACKACLWSRSGAKWAVAESSAFSNGPELAARVLEWLGPARVRALDRAGLASVGSREAEARASAELGRELGPRLVVAPDPGLENATRTPETVGADRLYAARGAYERRGTSAIVVDAGTAVTVDALEVDATALPRFLGGAIAPGPSLLAAALANGTARLPQVSSLRAPLDALGRDTESAIASGVVHGLRGAVRELAERVADEARLARAALVVTGGARRLLLEPLAFDPRRFECVEDEHLVHRGLCAALLDEPGAARTVRHGLAT
jgi:type III pantothenate kinase